jgi:hypothetical protein
MQYLESLCQATQLLTKNLFGAGGGRVREGMPAVAEQACPGTDWLVTESTESVLSDIVRGVWSPQVGGPVGGPTQFSSLLAL